MAITITIVRIVNRTKVETVGCEVFDGRAEGTTGNEGTGVGVGRNG